MTQQAGSAAELAVGDEVTVDIGPVAHGGSCVARHRGRVIFVRYALPGERAVVRITEARPGSFCRGEAVTIISADAHRVDPPCAHFGPGGCGGCDWQHASAELQRELKAAVIAEQLRRLAGLEVTVTVQALPGGDLGWRSRVRWAVDTGPRADPAAHAGPVAVGPRRFRSHEIVPISGAAPCLIAAPGLSRAAERLSAGAIHGADEVVLVARPDGDPIITPLRRGRPVAPAASTMRVAGRTFAVPPAGFWQAHHEAAAVLTEAVAQLLADLRITGGSAWDLYGGAGLFAPTLAAAVGPAGTVTTVESDRAAAADAAANVVDLKQVTAVCERVDRFLMTTGDAVDVALLDPPRSGAGRHICELIAGRRPAAIIYVACDPAALARDTGTFADAGYRLTELRAFDAFPQTHHVECIARFLPAAAVAGDGINTAAGDVINSAAGDVINTAAGDVSDQTAAPIDEGSRRV